MWPSRRRRSHSFRHWTRPGRSAWSPLPGAFIGALLGGASATGAARFQIVVLVGLLAAETITVALLTYLLGAPRTLPEL